MPSVQILGYAVLAIKLIHESRVHENEDNEDVNGALLGKPEPELEPRPRNPNLVQDVHKQDAAAERDNEPDREENPEVLEIRPPVRLFVECFGHRPPAH
jgi:hypothetical protein